MITHNLFVYGSLRSGFKNPAYEYLTRFFTYRGEGLVKGKFFGNGENPVAIPAETESYILGELYSLNNAEDFSWVFEQLDDYEGINTTEGKTPPYRRGLIQVRLQNDAAESWIYWYNRSVEGLSAIDTADLLQYMQLKNGNKD